MTTFRFKKDVKVRKPKRWYVMTNDMTFATFTWIKWSSDNSETLVRQKICEAGFERFLHTEKIGYSKRFKSYRGIRLFLYFQSPRDEAQFMLWAAGGLTI